MASNFWRSVDDRVEGVAPCPRAAHSCDMIGAKLFVFGGWSGNKALNDLFVLEVAKNLWIHVKTNNTPEERNNHTTTTVGHRLLVHGGHDGHKWLDDLHVLDTAPVTERRGHYDGLSWTKPSINGCPPSARACHTLTRVNEKLYMFGGYDGAKCFNDVEILDLETFSWIQPKCNGTPPQARNAHTVTVINSCLYLFGGHSGNKHLTDLHVFDTSTLTWSQPEITGLAPPGLRGHTANLVGSKIYLFGGYDGKARCNDLYILDTAQKKWLHPAQSENAPTGRQRHSACLVGCNQLYIFGGFDGSKWLSDLHIFDIALLEEDALTGTAVQCLIDNMRDSLLVKGDFSDVTLVVEGHEIKCHRAILASQCRYFHKMFSSDLKESRQNKIVIPNWSFAPFKAMLEFLYTARISPTDVDVLREVLGLADHFALDGLKSVCETSLSYAINDENVVTLFIDADRFQANEVKANCAEHINRNFDRLNRNRRLEDLMKYPHLTFELLTSRKLGVGSAARKTDSSSSHVAAPSESHVEDLEDSGGGYSSASYGGGGVYHSNKSYESDGGSSSTMRNQSSSTRTDELDDRKFADFRVDESSPSHEFAGDKSVRPAGVYSRPFGLQAQPQDALPRSGPSDSVGSTTSSLHCSGVSPVVGGCAVALAGSGGDSSGTSTPTTTTTTSSHNRVPSAAVGGGSAAAGGTSLFGRHAMLEEYSKAEPHGSTPHHVSSIPSASPPPTPPFAASGSSSLSSSGAVPSHAINGRRNRGGAEGHPPSWAVVGMDWTSTRPSSRGSVGNSSRRHATDNWSAAVGGDEAGSGGAETITTTAAAARSSSPSTRSPQVTAGGAASGCGWSGESGLAHASGS